MYREHFGFKELPFLMTPDPGFFCHLRAHTEALNTLLFSLQSGEGFIKVVSEVGSGKTLLCRKLLDALASETYVTAWIPNPALSPTELRYALARELSIDAATLVNHSHDLHTLIYERLWHLHANGKRVILLLDEAQALPDESLEALRLLTNLETSKVRLLQIVLFGQPELDVRLSQPHLRQLKQRISFSCRLDPLTRNELDTYLLHRMIIAGNTQPLFFSRRARDYLYRVTRGTPRLINVLCHKALILAYGKGKHQITRDIMVSAARDTEAVMLPNRRLIFTGIAVAISVAFILTYSFLLGIL